MNLNKGLNSKLKLPKLISDGMILQRDININIWGVADVGERVTINFIDKSYSTIADEDGKWTIILPKLKAGGPYDMEIKASISIKIKNILIGDVWICSGQSNMVIPMERVKPIYEDEISNCNNTYIRQFIVPDKYDFKKTNEDLESGTWQCANSDNILQFTAVGYFFAKSLFEKYHVPIGLIKACVGGTPITAWMSKDALEKFSGDIENIEILKDDEYINNVKRDEQYAINNWFKRLNENDKGLGKDGLSWFDLNYDDSDWPTMKLPALWEDEGLKPLNGVVWFRKEVYIPNSMAGKKAKLLIGTIVDSDTAYINGICVGSTGYQYPPRRYEVPENVLKSGKNIITIRVISNCGKGEFVKEKPYKLIIGDEVINLEGEWKYNIGSVNDEPLPPTTFFEYKPSGLFNGMISPLLKYHIKGVIWYQGESNTDNPKGYHELFSSMVLDWRKKFNQGDFPFLYVQLANFMKAKLEPSESKWAELRDEQRKSLDVPNVGMAVTIDIGEWNDLHPLNKKDVGNRLALLAQKLAYGDNDIVSSGPIYKSMKIDGNKIIIKFTNIGKGLVVKDSNELKHFAIAGLDRKFVWAKAVIEDDKVIVWSDKVKNPIIVRYAWADNPKDANLYNKEGLPASPFTTE